jgi:hypothetical protein
MKRSLRLTISYAVAALVLVGLTPAYAVTVFFDPSELTINVGDTYSLDLYGVADPADALLGYDLDLSFDPTQVSYLGVSSYGPNWVPPVVDPDGDGLAAFWDPLVLPDFSGSDLLLATLEFECIGCGVSVINTFVDPINGDRPLQEGVLQVIGASPSTMTPSARRSLRYLYQLQLL